MAKTDGSKKKKSESTPEGGDIHVGGNVAGDHIIVGSHNVINHYHQVVEKNTKQNDPDFWNLKHPYPMPPNFTGRIEERAMLTQWLDGDSENRLFILRALGGFGKSALAWQWLTHDVNPKTWKKVIFWSFYEGDASFEHFTRETLEYLGIKVPQGGRPQVDELLKAIQKDNILLIMDGFERVLRLYASMNAAYQGDEEEKVEEHQLDCKDINAEWFLKGICQIPKSKIKVLMTTRLTPRAIKPYGEFMLGCHETKLTAMQKADAVEFFHKQGIKGNRAEIEIACEPYGYHPLSLRLLAGRILKDFQNPGDISVAQKLKIDGDIIQQKHHVLDISYNSLPKPEQKLLSTIACFRSPVEYQTLQSIAENKDTLDTDLNDLIERGLLQRTTRLISNHPISIFDLHPIVRHFAYDHLTATDRTGAHKRLVNFFEAVPKPKKVEKLEDLAPVIELYHHMVGAGNLDEALELFQDRLVQKLYYQLGAYQLCIELLRASFTDGEEKPPRLKDEAWQVWAINFLASVYAMSGLPRRAIPLFKTANDMLEKAGKKENLDRGLANMAATQLVIGALSAAVLNLHRSIDLCHETKDEAYEAIYHCNLGHVQIYCGMWEGELLKSQKIFEKLGVTKTNFGSVNWSYRSLYCLLLARTKGSKHKTLSIEFARQALKLAEEHSIEHAPYPRDFARAYWVLGSAYRANNDLTLAEENLSKALNLCRQINMVDHEADILLDVARLRYAQGDFKDAQEKAFEALMITERSGYVLQGADVNLFLAQYALEQEKDNAKAKVYAEEAKKLATCDGPPYYYKVAYDEAVAMLEKL